jgi:hypothetical protein
MKNRKALIIIISIIVILVIALIVLASNRKRKTVELQETWSEEQEEVKGQEENEKQEELETENTTDLNEDLEETNDDLNVEDDTNNNNVSTNSATSNSASNTNTNKSTTSNTTTSNSTSSKNTNTSKNSSSRSSSNSNSNTTQESTNVSIPETPTLSNPSGGMSNGVKSLDLSIVYAGAYANGTSNISGYELYEKNGSKYTLINTSETKFSTDVTVDAGESKTYVARVYVYNKSKEKIYSKYSNEIKIDNSAPETPTLSKPAGGSDDKTIAAQLSIVFAGAYAESTSNISGYELYEKNGSTYTLIDTSETKFMTDVTVDVGESKTYVARVYVYNKLNKKIYSAYSNEIVIE